MPDTSIPIVLPLKRTGQFLKWLDKTSIIRIAGLGIFSYLAVVFLISVIEFSSQTFNYRLVVDTNFTKEIAPNPEVKFDDFLYFNASTILTVGYGDFRPNSLGKPLSIFEAFVGVGLFSVLLSVITIKLLLPPGDTVVFSRFAYYCTKPERFLIIFVNTSNTNLVNVEISSYFKLGGDWHLTPAVTAPFITQSVQTFYVDHLNSEELRLKLREGDCLRIGLTAGLGFASFSTSIQYHTEEILVIPDRIELIEFFEPLRLPDFTAPSLEGMFHYRPKEAITLEEHVRQMVQHNPNEIRHTR